MTILFFAGNSILLGVGLAMDAFSVSIANGLADPAMRTGERVRIAGTFAFFQFLMPMIGWFLVRTLVRLFRVFASWIPWIALLLLCGIGGKMIAEGRQASRADDGSTVHPAAGRVARGSDASISGDAVRLSGATLLLQGIATSIDALSVGFTIDGYGLAAAIGCALLIAAVTFVICMGGLSIGIRFGRRLAGRAGVFGGVLLIAIGLEIWLRGML